MQDRKTQAHTNNLGEFSKEQMTVSVNGPRHDITIDDRQASADNKLEQSQLETVTAEEAANYES